MILVAHSQFVVRGCATKRTRALPWAGESGTDSVPPNGHGLGFAWCVGGMGAAKDKEREPALRNNANVCCTNISSKTTPRNKLHVYLFGTIFLFPTLALAMESTNTQTVKSVMYDAASNFLYVTGANPWGVPGCPGATFILVHPNLAGQKQLFGATLAAQASGKTVRFQGTCNVDTRYFDATYIVVE